MYAENGKLFVLRVTQSNGARLYAVDGGMDYHKNVNCKLSKNNAGLVYI